MTLLLLLSGAGTGSEPEAPAVAIAGYTGTEPTPHGEILPPLFAVLIFLFVRIADGYTF